MLGNFGSVLSCYFDAVWFSYRTHNLKQRNWSDVSDFLLAAAVLEALNSACSLTVCIYASMFLCCPRKSGFHVSVVVKPEVLQVNCTASPGGAVVGGISGPVYVPLTPQQLSEGHGVIQLGVVSAAGAVQPGIHFCGQGRMQTRVDPTPCQVQQPIVAFAPPQMQGPPQAGNASTQAYPSALPSIPGPRLGPIHNNFLTQTIPLWNTIDTDATRRQVSSVPVPRGLANNAMPASIAPQDDCVLAKDVHVV
jgi:hypothetical protein